MTELSKRLAAAAGLVGGGKVLADIGTDHGYIPIALVSCGRCPRAIAMDINEGPLMRAKEHIQAYGLSGKIETRLSDGMKELRTGEAQSAVIAGMGGALVVKILDDSAEVVRHLDECILQPQSELFKVRDYLAGHGYEVTAEEMVFEDGKYYPMMRIRSGKPYTLTEVERFYGPILTRQRHPVLLEFLRREIAAKERLLDSLRQKDGEHIRARERELLEEIALAERAMAGKV